MLAVQLNKRRDRIGLRKADVIAYLDDGERLANAYALVRPGAARSSLWTPAFDFRLYVHLTGLGDFHPWMESAAGKIRVFKSFDRILRMLRALGYDGPITIYDENDPRRRPYPRAATRFRLSKTEALLKTELMAKAWEAHARLCDEVDKSLPCRTYDRNEVAIARLRYFSALKSLESFAAHVASKQREAFLREPANWTLTPDAEAVDFWIAAFSLLIKFSEAARPWRIGVSD